ncbi:MAG: Mbeg1-like protein [Atopobiaceae bacterium]
MANMFDYLDWFGGFDFYTVPFNEVDNLIFSQLSYLDLDGIVPATQGKDAWHSVTVTQAAQRYSDLYPAENPADLGPLISAHTNALLPAMAATKRFRDVRLRGYEARLDLDTHEQFGAVCAELPDGTIYVAYRGTGDDLVGWLEDCEMSYKIVPSQEHALEYLQRMGYLTRGPLRVGGHSKGGNLAAYAVAFCKPQLRERVIDVWCNDSPGFENQVIPLDSVRPIVPLVHFYTPEFSVVGALFDHLVEPTVIKSTGNNIMEHSAIEWQVMRGNFVRGTSTDNGSALVRQTFNQLMDSRDLPGRKKLLDALYAALTQQGIHGMGDMFSRGLAGINATMASVNSLDPDDREVMNNFLRGLIGAAVSNAVTETVTPMAKQLGQQLGQGLRGAVQALSKVAANVGTSDTDTADDASTADASTAQEDVAKADATMAENAASTSGAAASGAMGTATPGKASTASSSDTATVGSASDAPDSSAETSAAK